MAFMIDCKMVGYECRGVQEGTSKKGNPFRSIRLESAEGRTCEVSCTDGALFGAVDSMRKGGMYNLQVRAIAGRERSYIVLLSAPQVVTDNVYQEE